MMGISREETMASNNFTRKMQQRRALPSIVFQKN